jgi:6-phosphogluconolactonase/glucosamine-6-phosphate isomerase/deaminase
MLKVSPADRQGQGDIRLTLTPSVIPKSNHVIVVIETV